MPSPLDYLTTCEAGARLGIGSRRVLALIHEGRLPATMFGDVWWIHPEHLSSVAHRMPGRPKGKKRAKNRSYTEPSSEMKAFIFARDGLLCQFCGANDPDRSYIIAHLVYNGVACPHNLVVGCQSCNVLQGKELWLPKNFFQITENHPEWREQLLHTADKNFAGEEWGRSRLKMPSSTLIAQGSDLRDLREAHFISISGRE